VGIEERVFGGGGGGGGGSGTQTESGDDENPDEDEEETDSLSTYKYNDKIQFTDERIEELLDSLFEDCMGKTLIMELGNVTIQTGQDRSNFNWASSSINLKNHPIYGYRDYVLLEELIHTYQYQQLKEYFVERQLNLEIEAKVGWMMYRERIGKPLSKELQQKAFFTDEGIASINRLTKHYSRNTTDSNLAFQEDYMLFVHALTMNKNKKDYKSYTFSTTLSDWNFNQLDALMVACIEEY